MPKFLNNNRTFNSYTYENEIDNCEQTHYQLHFNQKVEITNLNVALHYIMEKVITNNIRKQEFEDYSLENIIIATDTLYSTDLIRENG